MYDNITTACIYARYSSANQTEQSIEGQLRVCREFAKNNGIEVTEYYIDRATSANKNIEKRVNFLKMIKDSEKQNFQAVIVYKLDRFSRSRYDMATYKYKLRKNGVQLISATENISHNPEGIILESVLEGMAEFYSAELSQKIKRGLNETALKHNHISGKPPLGYKVENKKLVINPETAPWVKEAFTMYAEGHSISYICKLFNDKGRKTITGSSFGKCSFTKMFRNEKYIGVYQFHDYRVENAIPAIIDKDLFDRVQQKIGEVRQAPARHKAKHNYLLSGKIFCGECGSRMNGDCNGYGGRYRCNGKKNYTKDCHKSDIKQDLIENLVAQDAISLLTDERIEEIASIAVRENRQDIESETHIPSLKGKLRETQLSLDNLAKAIEHGEIPDTLVKRMVELEKQKKIIEQQLKSEKKAVIYLDKEQIIFWLEQFKEGDIQDPDFKKTIIDLFVNSVTVWDDKDGHKVTIAYNLTSIKEKTYRLTKDDMSNLMGCEDTPTNLLISHSYPIIHKSLLIRTILLRVD